MSDSVRVAWRVNGERLTVLGWGRAVLLQLAHPLVAAGVDEHSTFRASPRDRLHRFDRTLGAMLKMTYGGPEEAQGAARGIDDIHGRVNGRLEETVGPFQAGTAYSARDPALLAWVHATLLDSTLLTYRRLIGPLSRADQDRYCADAMWIGPHLGIPDEMLPRDTAELTAYLKREIASGRIVVGPTARRLARDLLTPVAGPAGWLDLPVRLPYNLVTVGLLPPSIRAAYGLPWTPAHQAAFAITVMLCRLTVPLLPDALRRWPRARAAVGLARPPRGRGTFGSRSACAE
jgi:uncharacterized protein (DUF2236 family)